MYEMERTSILDRDNRWFTSGEGSRRKACSIYGVLRKVGTYGFRMPAHRHTLLGEHS